MTPLMVIGVPAGLDGIGAPPAGFGAAGIGSAEAGAGGRGGAGRRAPRFRGRVGGEPTGAAGGAGAGAGWAPASHAEVSMRYAAFTVDPPGGRRRGAAAGRPISPWPATRSGRPVW